MSALTGSPAPDIAAVFERIATSAENLSDLAGKLAELMRQHGDEIVMMPDPAPANGLLQGIISEHKAQMGEFNHVIRWLTRSTEGLTETIESLQRFRSGMDRDKDAGSDEPNEPNL